MAGINSVEFAVVAQSESCVELCELRAQSKTTPYFHTVSLSYLSVSLSLSYLTLSLLAFALDVAPNTLPLPGLPIVLVRTIGLD